jgi:hypothetical protein
LGWWKLLTGRDFAGLVSGATNPKFSKGKIMLTKLSTVEKKAKVREMRMFLKSHGVKRVINDPHKREHQFRRLVAEVGMELVQNDEGRLIVRDKQ